MGFSVFRSIMTVLICCFLAMLFLLPSAILRQFSAQANEWLDAAEAALLQNDPDAAAPYCAALRELMRDRMPVLERFLNHACVDSLDACFAIADLSVRAEDVCAAVEALAEARSVLERIEGIELFSWNNLL